MPAVSPSRISREYSPGFSWNFASATNVYWSQTTRPKIDAEKKIGRVVRDMDERTGRRDVGGTKDGR